MDIKTVGIDVSKTTLEVDALPERFSRQYSNDEAGIAALQADLLAQHRQMAIDRIVLEATGGYETAVRSFLI